MQILIIRGRLGLAGALRRTFAGMGYLVAECSGISAAKPWLVTGSIGLVVVEAELYHGTWREVLQIAFRSAERLPVVVAGRPHSMKEYQEAMAEGIRDFLAPPFSDLEAARILTAAGVPPPIPPRIPALPSTAAVPQGGPDAS